MTTATETRRTRHHEHAQLCLERTRQAREDADRQIWEYLTDHQPEPEE